MGYLAKYVCFSTLLHSVFNTCLPGWIQLHVGSLYLNAIVRAAKAMKIRDPQLPSDMCGQGWAKEAEYIYRNRNTE